MANGIENFLEVKKFLTEKRNIRLIVAPELIYLSVVKKTCIVA